MQDRSPRRLSLVGACVLALPLALACGGKSKGPAGEGLMHGDDGAARKVDPTLCETEGKKVVTFDLNRDRSPDVWKLYQTIEEGGTTLEILTCKQVDLNHDGNMDYVVAYNRKGAKVFEKFDFDFDGRFDALYIYNEKTGNLAEVQRESGFDGRYDILEEYDEKGMLRTVKHDRNGDGEPDMWEQYVDGELAAILYDDDFDNKVDRREEVKRDRPATPTPGNDVATGAPEDEDEDEAAGP